VTTARTERSLLQIDVGKTPASAPVTQRAGHDSRRAACAHFLDNNALVTEVGEPWIRSTPNMWHPTR
jgi:hypothetical protein